MPVNHRGESDMLRETITRLVYRTEYSSSYRGENDPFQNITVPRHISRKAALETSFKPFSSRAVQLPSPSSTPQHINLQGLEPNKTSASRRTKSATERRHWQFFAKNQQPARPFSRMTESARPRTDQLMQRPQSLVARRLQSQMSRFPKDFRYIDKQCFFHPAQEASKTFFVISPDWVSERQSNIRKNNVFS